jgi:hypothetical protein
VREQYAAVVPAAGSVVDLLVRAKDKQTGQPLKAHQIVAQVRRRMHCLGCQHVPRHICWCL